MKRFMNWIVKFDRSFPDPWIVDGVEQARPANQIGFLMGVAFTLAMYFILEKFQIIH